MLNNYSSLEKLFHRIALGSSIVKNISYDIESMIFGYDNTIENNKHVFICGYARAGTTILLNTFYNTKEFRSITYRDMPFVLMPNIWKFISKSFYKDMELNERTHGDGLKINYDSPEAFEEVFWQTFCGDEYIKEDGIIAHNVSDEAIDLFKKYVYCVLRSSGQNNIMKYISKNNNNIIRLGSINIAFPNALIIIPFRNPLQHAISLLRQHLKFVDIHKSDYFSQQYFKWLGHFEFGKGHIPFLIGDTINLDSVEYSSDDINYWLASWINIYNYLLINAQSMVYFVCYENLFGNPYQVLRPLFSFVDIDIDKYDLSHFSLAYTKVEDYNVSEELLDQANSVYSELNKKMVL